MKTEVRIIFAGVSLLAAQQAARGQVEKRPLRLSEIEAQGGTTWIELENTGSAREPLDGYSVQFERVDSSEPERGRHLFELPPGYTVPNRTDVTQPFFVLCLGGIPTRDEKPKCGSDDCLTDLCVPFDLDQDGGVVTLRWKPACQQVPRGLVDSVVYPPLPGGATFGRGFDGEWCVLSRRTPGKENLDPIVKASLCVLDNRHVMINEVSSAGAADWVELYLTDAGPDVLSLAGYVIGSKALEIPLPPVVLEKGGAGDGECDKRHAVILLGGPSPAGSCQARTYMARQGIGLNTNGDSLFIRSASGADWDRVTVPALTEAELFARIPDGKDFAVTAQPTPSMPNPTERANLPPSCQIIDRFPLKVVPGTDIDVYAEVLDRNGQDDLNAPELLWEVPGAGGGPAERHSVVMAPGKRITCERSEEPGIFKATIPQALQPGAGELFFWARVTDRAGAAMEPKKFVESERASVFVQAADWRDGVQEAHRLRINEVAANEINDLNGDWVEIFNPTSRDVSLAGMVITENVFEKDGRELISDEFFDPVVPHGGYIRVYLTEVLNAPQPHLAFRLDSCRDEVILIHSDGLHVIDVVSFHEEKALKTLGRLPDGGDDLAIMLPSPVRANAPTSCFAFKPIEADATLVLNEVISDNWASGHDPGLEYGDWLEIYNRGAEPQSLDCWSLSDSWSSDPQRGPRKRWRFPDGMTSLAPGDHLLVWCDNDTDCETRKINPTTWELHTSFQLNRSADFVQLLDPCGRVADFVMTGFQPRDISVGRFPDGEGSGAFLEPTPGGANQPLPAYRVQLPPTPCTAVPQEIAVGGEPSVCCSLFRRGDADINCAVQITDAVFTLNWLFQGGKVPRCQDAADANDNGRVDISDAIHSLGYQFLGGPPPPLPGPEVPGPDPTLDDLPPCDASDCPN